MTYFKTCPLRGVSILIALLVVTGCGSSAPPALFGNSTLNAYLSVLENYRHDFGAIPVLSVSEKTFTLVNEGKRDAVQINGTFTISAFRFKNGIYPGEGGTCTSRLAAGEQCTIVVEFSPGYADVFSEAINLSYFNFERTELTAVAELLGRGL